jgi:predicted MPP superfamily phosphohydrolase
VIAEVCALGGGVAVAGATVARVYRGGTTLNDHAVAAVVTGCVAIYPVLWLGARAAGVAGAALGVAGVVFGVAAVSLYGLFHVLDARRDAGRLMPLAHLSQPAFAFSLWCGLLLLVRAPVAAWVGASIWWPGGWIALPAGLALWGWAWTFLGHRERENVVTVPGLAAPVRVAHLSDLHASPTMRRVDLEALVDRVNALAPDIVVVTGDLVMPFSEAEHGFLIDALARLRAPTFVCLGNHDLPVADTLAAELAAVGVRVLVDAAAVVNVDGGVVEIVGVNFHWRDARGRLLAALDALPPRADAPARLLLAHDPRLFAWVPEGRFHLVLSGHTHGGQVGTDMFGVPWSVLRPLGVYDQGRFTRGATSLWVHRGNWHTGLPPRMGIATEVVVHRLVPV